MSKKNTIRNLTEREKKVLDCVYQKKPKKASGFGRNEIAQITNLPFETVTKVCWQLQERELLEISQGRQRWSVRPKGFKAQNEGTKEALDLLFGFITALEKSNKTFVKNQMTHVLYGLSLFQMQVYWQFLQGNETPYLIADQVLREKLHVLKQLLADKFYKKEGDYSSGQNDLNWINSDVLITFAFLFEKAGYSFNASPLNLKRLHNAGEAIMNFDLPIIHEDWINGIYEKSGIDKLSKTKRSLIKYKIEKNDFGSEYANAQRNLSKAWTEALLMSMMKLAGDGDGIKGFEKVEKLPDAELLKMLESAKNTESFAVAGDFPFQTATVIDFRNHLKYLKKKYKTQTKS